MGTVTESQDIKKVRGIRVQMVRGLLRLTIEKFAELTGYTRTTIIGWEQGQLSGLTDKGARAIVEATKNSPVICDFDWLLYGTGIPLQILSEDENIAQYQQDMMKFVTRTDEETLLRKEINQFQALYPNAITMQVQDDCMAPAFIVGDMVGGQRLYGEKMKKALHAVCIVQTADNQLLLRTLLPDTSNTAKFNLGSINQKPTLAKPILMGVDVISAAPLLRVWRKNK